MISGKCPKCGSTSIAGPHNIFGGNRHVALDLPGILTATLLAFTCMDCGYTEIYSDNLGLDNIRKSGRIYKNKSPRPTNCPNCGAAIRTGDFICQECGYDLTQNT